MTEITPEKETEKKGRELKCGEKIKAALEESNCTFDIGMLVTPTGNQPKIQIRALD